MAIYRRGRKKYLACLIFFILAGVFLFYRLTNPYAAFNALCKTGSVDEVRQAIEEGAECNPPLILLNVWGESNTLTEKTTHPDGIVTYTPLFTQDNVPGTNKLTYAVGWLRLRLCSLLFNYADEPPIQAAIRENPDPAVAALLIERGARDADGLLWLSFTVACLRRVTAEGALRPVMKRSWQLENLDTDKADTEAECVFASAMLKYSSRTIESYESGIWEIAFHSASPGPLIELFLSDGKMRKALLEQKSVMVAAKRYIKDPAVLALLLQAKGEQSR